MPDWVISLLVATIASGVGYLSIRYQYRKDRNDLASKLQEIMGKIAVDLEDERDKRRKLEVLYDELLTGLRKLIRQIEAAGIVPCWRPDENHAKKNGIIP
jgi:hypothetical protein